MVTLLNAEGTLVFEPDEEDVANVFGNLRGLCQRKVVTVKEAVVDDNDVVKGLLDFANKNLVHSIVIGASTKNHLPSLKKFKAFNDTPTAMMKSAPDYCSVYVISKLKIVSARSAVRSMANQTSPIKQLPFQVSSQSEFEGGIRSILPRTGETNEASESRSFDSIVGTVKGTARERPRSAGSNQSLDNIDLPGGRGRQWASMDEREMVTLAPIDDVNSDLDLIDSYGTKPTNLTSQELEAEMKRLRRELKQTMDMYSSACKQAISAKNQVM
ncbi:U-box domain-containing protein 35-like [Trifolium pratense]|uniref:RING-type E3 ubiquitin transferase n=1 Tax=Trifolium pratense TaxID=57577 RepID=A0A2K3NFP8_TRIPR|nr:U-box domain-containing protein 35-like [Trifolium pratense]